MQDSSPSNMPSPGPVPECRVVCLTGFMGSGKSTVGRMLAAQLAWHFADLDSEIETESGLSISQIFVQQGEAVFREIEHECHLVHAVEKERAAMPQSEAARLLHDCAG